MFGHTKLYGQVPGGQAEFLRAPQAPCGPIEVPESDEDPLGADAQGLDE